MARPGRSAWITREVCVAAVRAAMEDLGPVLTVTDYDAWRKRQPDHEGRYPTRWGMALTCGLLFSEVRAEAGGRGPDPLPVPSREEIMDALHAGHALSQRELMAARQHFGSAREAKLAAGVALRPQGAGRQFSDEEMVDALRACAADTGNVPGTARYRGWQRHHPDRPYGLTIANRFGGWSAAITAAGMEPNPDTWAVARAATTGAHYTEAALLAALRRCADDVGRAPTLTEYEHWRSQEDPSGQTIRYRFVSWSEAILRAFPVAS